MKLPFVGRLAYDTVSDALQAALERERESKAREQMLIVQLGELNQKLVEHVTRPAPVMEIRRPERDIVIDAIMERAGPNGQLRAHLSKWAMAERRKGTEDDLIVEQINNWSSPDDDDPRLS